MGVYPYFLKIWGGGLINFFGDVVPPPPRTGSEPRSSTRSGTGSEPKVAPEVNLEENLEANSEAGGVGDTPLAVTQEDCLALLCISWSN